MTECTIIIILASKKTNQYSFSAVSFSCIYFSPSFTIVGYHPHLPVSAAIGSHKMSNK